MISTNCRNNGVWAFFYPMTDVIGIQNSRFKEQGPCLTCSLTLLAAGFWLRFLRLLGWRSVGVGLAGASIALALAPDCVSSGL